MLVIRWKKNPARLPAACVFTAVTLAGGALIRLGVKERIAEQQAMAATLGSQAAYRIEQRVARELAIVEALARDLSRRTGPPFEEKVAAGERPTDQRTLFFVTAKTQSAAPPADAFEGGAMRHWAADLWPADSSLDRNAKVLGPKRGASGEWLALVRLPLQLATETDDGRLTDWVARSIPLDAFVHAADGKYLADSGFDFQIACLFPGSSRSRVIARSSEFDLAAPVVQVIHGTEGRWTIALAPRSGWVPWQLVLPKGVLVIVSALFGALLAADLARRPERLRLEVLARDRRLKAVHQRLGDEIQLRETLERKFSQANLHDAVTGLANRRYFMDRLGRALQHARQGPPGVLALLVITFDRLKNVNDSLGATAGDELLVQAVQRFKDSLGSREHVVARLADDEFGMLLFDAGSSEGARSTAESLQQVLTSPFTIGGQNVFVSASMGIALSMSGYEGTDELVRGAHIALVQADGDRRKRIAVFDPATREQIVTRQQLETDLHQAIERQEFCLNFQPIVSLTTGALAGFEVLIRWQHPLEGVIPPTSFIPLAEETGLIVHITRWVLREACRQARIWREQLPNDGDFYLSVNLSAQDLQQPDLCDFVARTVQEAGLPPGVLRLEVTEGVMIDNAKAVSDLVSRLRTMQVPLLLDDFGTGYSSLSYLNRFKFDYLKIDRSFVTRMMDPEQGAGIVRAIVHLAHDLGIRTIAEGVETSDHLEQLQSLGCDYGQGYWFSRPIQRDLAEKLLRSGTRWPRRLELLVRRGKHLVPAG